MSSILKVDQIQLSNGNTPTAGDLGLNQSGNVLQMKSNVVGTATTISSNATPIEVISVSITPKSSTSKLVIHTSVPRYTPGNVGSWSGSGGLFLYENNVSVQDGEHDGTITTEAQSHTLNMSWVSGNKTAGTQYTYSVRYKPTLGTANHDINRSPRKTIVWVLEIED